MQKLSNIWLQDSVSEVMLHMREHREENGDRTHSILHRHCELLLLGCQENLSLAEDFL